MTAARPFLTFTSCQAPIAEAFGAAVAAAVGERIGVATRFVNDIPWPERLVVFDEGRIDVCWMCGLPYVWRSDRGDGGVELLAAPVMSGPRYGGQPVYFSDVVVRADGPWSSFADLRGVRWGYNEDTSHSGYNAVRRHLAEMGSGRDFFGSIECTGSHEASLVRLREGAIDATAIDSTVLDLARLRDPSLADGLRTIAVFGPSPAPPWVVGPRVPHDLRARLRDALLALPAEEAGRRALAAGLVARFVTVTDADYDPIRRAASEAESVGTF
jgi:phosphonate transport system substrate-binding protein